MNNWLNYHHLYYFKHVADLGSIAKASEVLNVGQPAISMQIKSLEESLGRNLFERRNKKLLLNENGQIVYNYASQIFNLGAELLTTLDDRALNHVKIQIGIQSSVPKNLISKLTSYIYEHFNAVVSIFNGTAEEVILGVINHKLDIAILNHRPVVQDRSIVFAKKILDSNIVLAGSEKFKHLAGSPISDFQGAPLILPTAHSVLRHSVEYYFNQNELKMNMVAEADDTQVQKNMAVSGNGIVPILKEAIDGYLKSNQLFILKELEEIHDEIWIVAGKRDISNPIGNKLISEFKF